MQEHQSGFEIAYRMSWIIQYLLKKCKTVKNSPYLQLETGIDVWKNNEAFLQLMTDVAVAQHSFDKAPEAAPKLEAIKDPYTIAHIVLAGKKIQDMTKKDLDELTRKAFIPNTKFKKLLQQLGANFLNAISNAPLGGAVQE